MKHERFETEPRPAAVGGGWAPAFDWSRFGNRWRDRAWWRRLSSRPGEDERDAYADAMQTGQEWLDDDVTDSQSMSDNGVV